MALLLLTAGGGAAAPAQEGGLGDTGFASLFTRQQVTVVYPDHGARAESNRRSAESRADFLRDSGIETVRVVADDALGADERGGNLLVLGWDNRLFADAGIEVPFRKMESGFAFRGIVDRNAEADLALWHVSPFDPAGRLAFWSRIDPERDRFMVLPLVGSDWTVFHDYLPVRQGMFQGAEWPPRRRQAAEKDHTMDLARRRAARVEIEGSRYTLGYDPNEVREEDARRVLAAREAALEAAAAKLGVDPGELRPRVELYLAADSKRALTGVPDAVHSHPSRPELHMIARASMSSSPHEEIHLLARRYLGPCYVSGLYEGLSVEREGSYRGTALDLFAAMLVDRGDVPTLATLLSEAGQRTLSETIRFPASGLMVSWVRARFGDAAVRAAYGIERGTLDALAESLGRPADGLEADFAQWVGELAATQQEELAYTKVMARAREHHLVADHAAMVAAMHEALKIKPRDPYALQNLAAAEMRLGAYDDAERHLKELLGLELGPDSRFLIFGTWDLGRLYDIQGRREEAVEQYRKVLELPDLFELHLMARGALQRPVTAESLE
jgi:Flp pilus assembly protein TadD